MEDTVTGAGVEVELGADQPPERIWDLVTDVTRIGEWSPECVGARWLTAVGDRPAAGDRFEGRNEFGGGSTTVECVVTEALRPRAFAFVVLDGDGQAGSIWRYQLRPAGAGTVITHTFTHGPGLTGMREGARRDPAAAERRLETLRRNMTATLQAMIGGTGA